MTGIVRQALLGSAAAAVATLTKTQAEATLQPLAERLLPPAPAARAEIGADPAGHPENMPPAELADEASQAVTGRALTDAQRRQASSSLHWVMGVGAGVVYAFVQRRRSAHGIVNGVANGAAAGTALFATTHLTSLPAAGLQHPPWALPRAWWLWEGGSHVIYGAVLGGLLGVADRVAPRSD